MYVTYATRTWGDEGGSALERQDGRGKCDDHERVGEVVILGGEGWQRNILDDQPPKVVAHFHAAEECVSHAEVQAHVCRCSMWVKQVGTEGADLFALACGLLYVR